MSTGAPFQTKKNTLFSQLDPDEKGKKMRIHADPKPPNKHWLMMNPTEKNLEFQKMYTCRFKNLEPV